MRAWAATSGFSSRNRALLYLPSLIIVASAIWKSTGDWSDFAGYLRAGSEMLAGRYTDYVRNTWPPFFSVMAIPLTALDRLPPAPARASWATLNTAVFFW